MRIIFVLIGLLVGSIVHGQVTDSTQHGFTSEHRLVVEASPHDTFVALTQSVHLWWDAGHSYGGQAEAFSIDAEAGGCFCEAMSNGGSVEHLRVVNVQPDQSITFHGALGPLQNMAVNGSMHFRFEPHAKGTQVTYRYVVGGYVAGGLKSLAGPVDQVQLGQLQRLQKFIQTGTPLNSQ